MSKHQPEWVDPLVILMVGIPIVWMCSLAAAFMPHEHWWSFPLFVTICSACIVFMVTLAVLVFPRITKRLWEEE